MEFETRTRMLAQPARDHEPTLVRILDDFATRDEFDAVIHRGVHRAILGLAEVHGLLECGKAHALPRHAVDALDLGERARVLGAAISGQEDLIARHPLPLLA